MNCLEQLGVEIDNADKHVIRLFAKWYAEKVIDKCAEKARLKVDNFDCYNGKTLESTIETSVTNTWGDAEEEVTVHEASILNVKNLL